MARVLVVDDQPGVLRLMRVALELGGFEVAAFQDPEVAAEAFTRDPDGYDIVVTDVMMPCMTGTELAGLILETRPEMPVVFVTGYAAPVGLPRAGLLSKYPVLLKPGEIRLLKDTVARLVRRPLPPAAENPGVVAAHANADANHGRIKI